MHLALPDLSNRDKIILISIAILVALIPVGTYVLSLRMKAQSSASEVTSNVPRTDTPEFSTDPKSELVSLSQQAADQNKQTGLAQPTPEPTAEVFFGPTLKFKISLEARPSAKQATKLFVGIASGKPASGTTPQYIISYQVDVPDIGEYSGLSLAGLTQGSTYTAYLKGQAQIATSSAFLLNPTSNDLGTVKMTTGDVNDDNIINDSDYNLVKGAIGAGPSSSKWNSIYDFNLDNIINSWDLGIIGAHLGKTGESGVVKSTYNSFGDLNKEFAEGPVPSPNQGTTTTPSFFLLDQNFPSPTSTPDIKPGGQEGYWIWLPKP
ncbi:MAG: hypothetical protein ACD_30C00042G0012 [uncultured bacterium]|uniref:Dockerin domain-containing protein n=2 Tax=Candidatus Daviesiibacteriota TaxID=1752718 RepID=A0A0G0EU06_9BACT|nr:MAG: hypothetical protein ACD_30C00042G0012 [uncultured bacterium]KKQ09057.1 MAG: hypothetical protein US19_C0017G0002 [Candidatus Daviesbacteria bacterium GW2011_GWB1_36_5]KKQ16094.1 MAG: hypothetical protein US28_C0005G0009 [Candidatus Daviesbacteria bacterium GW2011_GWA1_36_8]OGE32230.1 MAG: hypothetical protein A3C99_02650 [Candidatus Daviesbacteria bacterium RIFCSPHIGHO2_02_FULL_37_9]